MFIYHYELCKLIFYIIPFNREISEFYTFCLCFRSFDLEIFGSRLIIHIFCAFKLPPIDLKSFVMCQFNGRSSHRPNQSSFQLSCSLDISARVSCGACVGGLFQFAVLPAATFGELFWEENVRKCCVTVVVLLKSQVMPYRRVPFVCFVSICCDCNYEWMWLQLKWNVF